MWNLVAQTYDRKHAYSIAIVVSVHDSQKKAREAGEEACASGYVVVHESQSILPIQDIFKFTVEEIIP